MDQAEFLGRIDEAVRNHCRLRVLHHNVHSMALCQSDEDLRDCYATADLIFIDGTPVVTIARLMGEPVRLVHRRAVLDWFWPLVELATDREWRVLHVGSNEPVISRALAAIAERHPKARFHALPGFFDQTPGSVGSEEMLAQIESLEPDVLLLGLGMPLQERWLQAVSYRLPPCPVITVGGILGFIGSDRPTAPRWLGPIGLEWTFRLATEPRRLWRRYLIEPWVLTRPLTKELLDRRSRRRSTPPGHA